MNLPEHLEMFLGTIETGWQRDADGRKLPFQVARFARGPRPGTVTFSTLGLSKIPLHSRTTGKEIYHELLIIVPESLRDRPVPGILQQVGKEAIASGHALLRGDVVGPRGPLFSEDSKMEAHGWSRFEDELVRADLDLIDPDRQEVLR